MLVKKTLELRGIRRKDIIDYFLGLGGKKANELLIAGEGWQVEIGEEISVRLGALQFPDVTITIYCDELLLGPMVDEFRMRFLTAGG